VVKVAVDGNKISIPELHYAVDCGVVVNEDRVKSQFEGGAVYALSGALKSSISFKNGRVVESNFNDYQLARMPDAPGEIFVHLIDSSEKPTGVGEPPVPPVAPALCNVYQDAVKNGDVAVIGIISDALVDSSLNYKAVILNHTFLKDARDHLSLPKDFEAILPL
jgi:hypothetical protein